MLIRLSADIPGNLFSTGVREKKGETCVVVIDPGLDECELTLHQDGALGRGTGEKKKESGGQIAADQQQQEQQAGPHCC